MNDLQRGPRKSLSPLFNVPGPDVSAGLVFSDEIHAISAAIGAHCVALMNRQLIEGEGEGRVVDAAVWAGDGRQAVHLAYPGSRHDDSTVRAVREWVMKVPGGLCEVMD